MGFLGNLFNSKERTKKTCRSLYDKARSARPDKPERDYLKIVLLTKPPFDYQFDSVIDGMLNEFCKNIDELGKHIADWQGDGSLWANRERNLKRYKEKLKTRNEVFFKELWHYTFSFCTILMNEYGFPLTSVTRRRVTGTDRTAHLGVASGRPPSTGMVAPVVGVWRVAKYMTAFATCVAVIFVLRRLRFL